MEENVNIVSKFERLKNIGFREVGKWTSTTGGIDFELDEKERSSKNILYAFISDSEILYIGKTIQRLYKRMHGYKNPGSSQTTNIENKKNIIEMLQKNFSVSIYVLPDHGLLLYGGFHLNLAAGLEDSLIKDINPKWNMRGVQK